MIATTEQDQRTALQDVDDGAVVYYTVASPAPGYRWSDGGRMPHDEAVELDALHHGGFLELVPPQNVGDRLARRRRVALTEGGQAALRAA